MRQRQSTECRVYVARDDLSIVVEALDQQSRMVQIVLEAPVAMTLADQLTRMAEPVMAEMVA